MHIPSTFTMAIMDYHTGSQYVACKTIGLFLIIVCLVRMLKHYMPQLMGQ
nr:MAG TPA: hypothetical protein [Caudoviricetes sp.]